MVSLLLAVALGMGAGAFGATALTVGLGRKQRGVIARRLAKLGQRLPGTNARLLQGATLLALVEGLRVRVTVLGPRSTANPLVTIAGRGPLRRIWAGAHPEPRVYEEFEEPRVTTRDSAFDAGLFVRGPEPSVRAMLDEATRRALYTRALDERVRIAGGRIVWAPSGLLSDRPEDLEALAQGILELTRLAKALDLPEEEVPWRLAANARDDRLEEVRLANLCTLLRAYPGHESALAGIRDALQDPAASVRFLAARRSPEASAQILRELAFREEHPPRIRARAIDVLTARGLLCAADAATLSDLIQSADHHLAYSAASALGTLQGPLVEDSLILLLDREDRSLSLAAIRALARCGTRRALRPIRRAGQRPPLARDGQIRRAATSALERIEKREGPSETGLLSLACLGQRGEIAVVSGERPRSERPLSTGTGDV